MSVYLAGTVPLGLPCRTCGKFVMDAGAYWQGHPPTEAQMSEFRSTFDCPECARVRKIIREEMGSVRPTEGTP